MSKEVKNLSKPVKDQLDLDKKQDKTDENLLTESKDLVGAINELFQNANNGKQLIASAIGEPVSADDTFQAMSNDINDLLSTFRTNMANSGVIVEAGDKFKQLIEKITTMTEGKGIRYMSGAYSLGEVIPFSEYDYDDGAWHNYCDYQSINIPKDFDMNFIYIYTDYNYSYTDPDSKRTYDVYAMDCILYDTSLQTLDDGSVYVYCHNLYDVYDVETGEDYNWGAWTNTVKSIDNTDYVSLPLIGSYYWGTNALSDNNITHNAYYAIGLGEEDTTLRDLLASILTEEGVSVAEEDDVFSLVNKVDEEFDRQNIEVDNGKQLIASAIGNPLITSDSTFNAMSEAILGLRKESGNETDAREVLYGMMIEDGYDNANSEMTVDELIDLLDRSGIGISDIKQIACGYKHTIILKNNGSVWACGWNDSGQLGLGDTADRATLTKVTTSINNDVKQVYCGSNHTFIIKTDGSVWSCGYNKYGQLGLNDTVNKNTFTQVTTNINNDVKQVYCGFRHTFILKNDGSLWASGYNVYGHLGLGNATDRYIFTKVTTNISDIKQIACGFYHTFILKNDGSVWSCGFNDGGQLGLGNNTNKNTFTKVTTNINDVKQIVCGSYHTFIIKNNGSVWCCGQNSYGQLGLGNNNNKNTFTQVITNINNDVKQIDCGECCTIILKNDGSVLSCGKNTYGQLGLGNTTNKNTFTKVTTNINNDVEQIICDGEHTFIIKNDGSLWGCGLNYQGQLGLGDTTDRYTFTNTNLSTPIPEYDKDRLALYNYLLSNNIEVTESMDIGTMLGLLVSDYMNNMILGYESNLRIILTDENVELTGDETLADLIIKTDEKFEVNRNNLINIMIDKGYTLNRTESFDDLLELLIKSNIKINEIKNIFCGNSYTFLIKNNGEVYSCGLNDYGQLGLGNTTNRSTFTKVNINNVKTISCGGGWSHTLALTNNGEVYSCGNNSHGQLGLGDTTNRSTFTKVNISDVKDIMCADGHTFLIKNNGEVYSCGRNSFGQLGLGDSNNRSIFAKVNINNVKTISCGYYHTFILKNDGTVHSCGYNKNGQLGLNDTANRLTFTQVTTDTKQVAGGGYHTFIIKNDGSLWACGGNNYGQLGLGTSTTIYNTFTKVTTNINNDVKQVACGNEHTIILKNDGSVWSCGFNSYGQLGLGDNTNRTTFTKTNLTNCETISCGSIMMFIMTNYGAVYCCGSNSAGQLGLGNITGTDVPVQVNI